jgi:type IV pilus assembly protein PilV
MRNRHRVHVCRASGFTLVEVLVAAVIVSLSVVGGVRLQTLALDALRAALQRALATHLAADMTERLLAMPTQATRYVCGPCGSQDASTAGPQLADWLENVSSSLPSATTVVRVDAATTAAPWRVQVALTWGDGERSATSAAQLPGSEP